MTEPRPSYEPVEIPAEIPIRKQNHWIKTLYLLPRNHPDRLELRDKLAGLLKSSFDQLDKEDLDGRLSIVEEAFALHDPADFRPGLVAEQAKPLAKWLIETFQKRGDEALVLAGLRYMMLAEPEEVEYREHYLRLAEWSESVRETVLDEIERLSSLIKLYQNMVRLVPDPQVVEKLADLHVERYRMILSQFDDNNAVTSALAHLNPFEAYKQGRMLQTFPIEVIHAYFLAGNPAGARKHLEGHVDEGHLAVEYLELLDRVYHGRDTADSYYTLAWHMAPLDTRAGLRACILARASDRQNPRFPLCIGTLFEEMGRPECAIEFYAEAAEIAPENDTLTEVLEKLRTTLLKVHVDEKIDTVQDAIDIGDGLVARALDLDPSRDSKLRDAVAGLLYTMGVVEFDNGDISASIGHLDQTFEVSEYLPALSKLAEVYYLRNDFKRALHVLDRAFASRSKKRKIPPGLNALMLEQRADSLASLGNDKEAQRVYRMALDSWESTDIPLGQAAEAAVRRGVIFDRLDELESSKASFQIAVRLNPDREATYADLMSFLVIRGHLEQAKEFYRLAYNQDRIDVMWKIYYSLWVEGLSLRQGKGSFDLARSYLMHSGGDTWQDKIAGYFTGQMTLDELRSHASNEGQQVEAEYYGAIIALAEGRKDDARILLEKVVASHLLGFFEYRMARELLLDPDIW